MQHIIEGCGDRFQRDVTPELRDLIYRALLHPNRFVRETCYLIMATICRVCAGPELGVLPILVWGTGFNFRRP